MSNENLHVTVIRRTSIIVAYITYTLGTVVLLLEREGWLLTQILDDFPGWRSVIVIVSFLILALVIPRVTSCLIQWYFGRRL